MDNILVELDIWYPNGTAMGNVAAAQRTSHLAFIYARADTDINPPSLFGATHVVGFPLAPDTGSRKDMAFTLGSKLQLHHDAGLRRTSAPGADHSAI